MDFSDDVDLSRSWCEERVSLGPQINSTWVRDPRRLLFVMSRYKFVSKMFEGRNRVLEVGCSDGWGTRIVRQSVGGLTGVDIDVKALDWAGEHNPERWHVDYLRHDVISEGRVPGVFDSSFSLDVLEHIHPTSEDAFIENMAQRETIIGMPTTASQQYAASVSKRHHINCKTHEELRSLMENWFDHVFMFSMNDEVVHTGHGGMAHYIFALGVR